MSIASQLAALAANKAAIKAAIISKNPATPLTDALASWPASIESIPSGGDTPSGRTFTDGEVKFIDYDGTVLTSYTIAEASALTAMPALPSHEGLSAQGWNYTLEQMKSNLSSGACNIGCMYTTDDGKTRITLTIQDPKYSEIPLVFQQTAANGVEVDWGDGSATQTYASTSQQTITHQYSPTQYPATYTVTFKVNSGTMSFPSYIMGKYAATQSATNPVSVRINMIDFINIGSAVTSIGSYAFNGCYSLASITISNSVTSIGRVAFQFCYSLASITIPNSVTSIENGAFNGCYSLASITIPNSVTSIGDTVFQGCTSLSSITIPNSVTSIGDNVFNGCNSLASITISNGVTSIGDNVFSGCYSLASITIPNSVTSIGDTVFQGCTSLSSITIPNSVTSIGDNVFNGCNSLASITISNGVTSIGDNVFSGCYSLASITIPNSVTSIGNSVFYKCYGIKTFDFRTATAVPQLGDVNAFQSTPTDKEIIVPDELYDTWKGASNWSETTNNIVNCIVKASESSLGPLS